MLKEKIEDTINTYIQENLYPKNLSFIHKTFSELSLILNQNWFVNFFVTWSVARWTSKHPVSDLDVICILDEFFEYEKFNLSSLEKIKKLIDGLQKHYWEKNVKIQSHSIGITFPWDTEFSIDIVPAKKTNIQNLDNTDFIYEVPEIITKKWKLKREAFYKKVLDENIIIKWIKSDPKGYIKEAERIKNLNNFFIPAVVLLKTWKYYKWEKYEKFLKSFHIEEYIKNIVKWNNDITLLDLIICIKNINIDIPKIVDRAGDKYIDDYLQSDDFRKSKLMVSQEINLLYENISSLESKDNKEDIENILDRITWLDKNKKIEIPHIAKFLKPVTAPTWPHFNFFENDLFNR